MNSMRQCDRELPRGGCFARAAGLSIVRNDVQKAFAVFPGLCERFLAKSGRQGCRWQLTEIPPIRAAVELPVTVSPRPLPARHSPEHRHDAAAGRLPRRCGSTSSSPPASRLGPGLPPRRHGLSRSVDDRAARLLARLRGLAARRAAAAWCSSPPRRDMPYTEFGFRARRHPAARPRSGRRAGGGA